MSFCFVKMNHLANLEVKQKHTRSKNFTNEFSTIDVCSVMSLYISKLFSVLFGHLGVI